jgi:hypothetical protein
MKRWLTLVVLGVLIVFALLYGGAIANADEQPPPRTIVAPSGWTIDSEASKALGAKLRGVSQFGLASQPYVNVDLYTPSPAPGRAGIALTVTLVAVECTPQCDAAARAAVDDLRAMPARAALGGSSIVENGSQERVDPVAKQAEATLEWRDATVNITTQARRLVASDGKNLIAVTAECLASDDADKQRVADCKAALATLDLGLPARLRVPLALPPAGSQPTPTAGSAGSGQQPAAMGDGSRAPLPPITVPQEGRTTDRRPVYVGLGLVVLAAVFWWNRHRQSRREEKSQ